MSSAAILFEQWLHLHNLTGLQRSDVCRSQLGMLLRSGQTVEHLLEHLVRTREVLLHGSPYWIEDWELKPGRDGVIYATDLARIALVKALFSNHDLSPPGLVYPHDASAPFALTIHGRNHHTGPSRGFVYIIGREQLRRMPPHSSQFTCDGDQVRIPIAARVEIVPGDFLYPVFDATTSECGTAPEGADTRTFDADL